MPPKPSAADPSQTPEWKQLMRCSLRRGSDVAEFTPEEQADIDRVRRLYPFFSNEYYTGLIQEKDDPIWKQVIPSAEELDAADDYVLDSLGEDGDDSPVKHLTHRYPDRVLFTVTYTCGVYCRFCTRKRKVGKNPVPPWHELEAVFAYLREHTGVRDVLLSGGDPLLLADDQLDRILTELRAIPHIKILRIGTRLPCVLPQRITPELADMLKKHHPLYINTHFNHPRELTPEAARACALLADAGIPLGCQTVLMKGINDDIEIMKELMLGLLDMRVKPYYLYQADLVTGTGHFRTDVQTGIDIVNGLQGHITGFAVPTYIIDAPGGGGKMAVGPNRLLELNDEHAVLENYEGNTFKYPARAPEGTLIQDYV
jgi:lysine 2,3-aminomutase